MGKVYVFVGDDGDGVVIYGVEEGLVVFVGVLLVIYVWSGVEDLGRRGGYGISF